MCHSAALCFLSLLKIVSDVRFWRLFSDASIHFQFPPNHQSHHDDLSYQRVVSPPPADRCRPLPGLRRRRIGRLRSSIAAPPAASSPELSASLFFVGSSKLCQSPASQQHRPPPPTTQPPPPFQGSFLLRPAGPVLHCGSVSTRRQQTQQPVDAIDFRFNAAKESQGKKTAQCTKGAPVATDKTKPEWEDIIYHDQNFNCQRTSLRVRSDRISFTCTRRLPKQQIHKHSRMTQL